MGSVKDLMVQHPMYIPPAPHKQGIGPWRVKGTFSVGDLKYLIKPVEIPNKGVALAMMAGLYWEHAATVGFQNSYAGMLDTDDRITDAQTLLDQGDLSNVVVMHLAVTPHMYAPDGKLTDEIRGIYHRLISSGDLTNYVGDCECIFRFGLPLGSSYYKRIAIAAGLGDEYEQVAKLEETIQFLDQIRGITGILDKPEMVTVLKMMGLDRIPNPGYIGTKPYLNFDAKFDPGGDEHYSFTEAQDALHLNRRNWKGLLSRLVDNSYDQWDYCLELSSTHFLDKLSAH
ncbi:MAG: hypothetical protein NTZ65_04795 [Candidatus Berkelbacteria bacterium]|nr:hypothetical protein [Candidatus Berkelbacteria bacterium]